MCRAAWLGKHLGSLEAATSDHLLGALSAHKLREEPQPTSTYLNLPPTSLQSAVMGCCGSKTVLVEFDQLLEAGQLKEAQGDATREGTAIISIWRMIYLAHTRVLHSSTEECNLEGRGQSPSVECV